MVQSVFFQHISRPFQVVCVTFCYIEWAFIMVAMPFKFKHKLESLVAFPSRSVMLHPGM